MSTAESKAAALARQKKGTTAATAFSIGRAHGAAAATTPSSSFGTTTTTSSHAGFGAAATAAASSQAGFGAAAAASTLAGFGLAVTDSSPIGRSFTGNSSLARGGWSGASPIWFDAADRGSPISPAHRRPANRDWFYPNCFKIYC